MPVFVVVVLKDGNIPVTEEGCSVWVFADRLDAEARLEIIRDAFTQSHVEVSVQLYETKMVEAPVR